MKNKYHNLIKNVLLFTINGFFPKLLSFILVPIYTGVLTTAEYGVFDLIIVTIAFLIPIFTLDIQDSVMYFSFDKDYKNDDVFSTGLKIILKGFCFIAAGALIVSMYGIEGMRNYYLVFFVLKYLTNALRNSVSLFCRGIDKVSVVVTGGIINSVVTFTANILFLVLFKWGLKGYVFANVIGDVIDLVYCFFGAKLYKYIKLKIPVSVRKDMIHYSFPLIFGAIAWWMNNVSDRYILSWISGIAVSGIYAVAYKIPNLLSIIQNIFSQAWSISVIKEFDKDDSDGFIGGMYTMMNFAMVLVCSVLMILNVPIAKLLYSKEFFAAWQFVPPLLISVVFNAMSLFTGSIFTAVKATKTMSVSIVTGTVVNTVFNVIFIYFFGAYGAAVATLIGNAVTHIMRVVSLKNYINMKVNYKRDIAGYLLLGLQMAVAATQNLFVQTVILIFIPVLYRAEIKNLTGLIGRKIRSLKGIRGK